MKFFDILFEQGYGKDNSNWKGNKVKERAKHIRQEVKQGKASDKPCPLCGSREHMEWATMPSGKMVRRCRSCHSKMDEKHKNLGK
jgi:DNA repair exonuclease SbcCD ATPase subunit